jgi:flagellar basal body-associated protein FliL
MKSIITTIILICTTIMCAPLGIIISLIMENQEKEQKQKEYYANNQNRSDKR